MKSKLFIPGLVLLFTGIILLSGCRQYDNFVTYFNTYYNADRLIDEAEDEFEYQDERRRVRPRVFVPETEIFVPLDHKTGAPPFMNDFVVDQRKLQPVKIKLDSVVIKGSKILARHPKSNFIEGTLYLMALSYFYQSDWINSQIKCSELIDKFPEGRYSPDAHLMLAKNYLIRRKFHPGRILLSRTVDIAWQLRRYDILTEAFRLEAELSLYENDREAALRPYLQAIAQSDDSRQTAKWLIDLGALLYRMNRFEEAEKSFTRARTFRTDYVGDFESFLYQALCLIRMERYDEGEVILNRLARDGKYAEWMDFVHAARMTMFRLQNNFTEYELAEQYADTAYSNSLPMNGVYFEKGMEYFEEGEFNEARKYFARTRAARSDIYTTANYMYNLLTNWNQKRQEIQPGFAKLNKNEITNDTAIAVLANATFDYARIQERLGNQDSATYFYLRAAETCPPNFYEEAARYIYAYSYNLIETDPRSSDSLLEILVEKYPLTPYGQDAMKRLGYTMKFHIDTIAEHFESGIQLRKNYEYNYAIEKFDYVQLKYPNSDFAPRALYNIGWIYEKNLNVPQKALHYYRELLARYPNSVYARDVSIAVDFLSVKTSGEPLPDSLKPKHFSVVPPELQGHEGVLQDSKQQEIQKQQEIMEQRLLEHQAREKQLQEEQRQLEENKIESPGGLLQGAREFIRDPSKILGGFEEQIPKPSTLIPNINISNPLEGLESTPEETQSEPSNESEEKSEEAEESEKVK